MSNNRAAIMLMSAGMVLAACGAEPTEPAAEAEQAAVAAPAVSWTNAAPEIPAFVATPTTEAADRQFGPGSAQAAYDEMTEYAATLFIDPETFIDEETPGDHTVDDVADNMARMTPAYAETFRSSVETLLDYHRGIEDGLPEDEVTRRQEATRVTYGSVLLDVTSKDPANPLHPSTEGGAFVTANRISDPEVYLHNETGQMMVGLSQHLEVAMVEGDTPNAYTLDRRVYYFLKIASAHDDHEWAIDDITIKEWTTTFANGPGTGFVDS